MMTYFIMSQFKVKPKQEDHCPPPKDQIIKIEEGTANTLLALLELIQPNTGQRSFDSYWLYQTGNDGLNAAYTLDTEDVAPVAGPAGRILAAHPRDSSYWEDHTDFDVEALQKDVSANTKRWC
tara:strand:- start:189 stop:557 length:369 start_codon:yes stop_codon:yes gene_type:complete